MISYVLFDKIAFYIILKMRRNAMNTFINQKTGCLYGSSESIGHVTDMVLIGKSNESGAVKFDTIRGCNGFQVRLDGRGNGQTLAEKYADGVALIAQLVAGGGIFNDQFDGCQIGLCVGGHNNTACRFHQQLIT